LISTYDLLGLLVIKTIGSQTSGCEEFCLVGCNAKEPIESWPAFERDLLPSSGRKVRQVRIRQEAACWRQHVTAKHCRR
jgi:hypothetical protein